jgi:chemotaxis protein methyltransferase CheR
MQRLGCRNVAAYLRALEADRTAEEECERLMCVSVSRFFRDRRLWEVLEARIIPSLLKDGPDPLRAWSAGCGCGEEVYSLKILWDRLVRARGRTSRLEITGTDMNPVHLQRAEQAHYPASSLKEVPEGLNDFSDTGHAQGFEVARPLREGIRWQRMDLREVQLVCLFISSFCETAS